MALRQFDLGLQMIGEGIERGPSFKLSPVSNSGLHFRKLWMGWPCAGSWHQLVGIEGSEHEPVGALTSFRLSSKRCADYINDSWQNKMRSILLLTLCGA